MSIIEVRLKNYDHYDPHDQFLAIDEMTVNDDIEVYIHDVIGLDVHEELFHLVADSCVGADISRFEIRSILRDRVPVIVVNDDEEILYYYDPTDEHVLLDLPSDYHGPEISIESLEYLLSDEYLRAHRLWC